MEFCSPDLKLRISGGVLVMTPSHHESVYIVDICLWMATVLVIVNHMKFLTHLFLDYVLGIVAH